MDGTTMLGGLRPRFGVGSLVCHAHFGSGCIMSYEGDAYVILFRGGETRRVAFTLEDMKAEAWPAIPRSIQETDEVHVLLLGPKTTLNTGDVGGERTVIAPEGL